MARPALSLAGTLLATIAASACVLVASGSTSLQTTACDFQGQTTACGVCVLGSCIGLLNLCCTDSSCSQNLPYLDGCASGTAPLDCTLLVNGADFGASDSFIAFGTCVAESCPSCTGAGGDSGSMDAPAPPPPEDVTAGPVYSCSDDGSTCFCEYSVDLPSSSFQCAASAYSDGICCADANYGRVSGTTCTCSPFSCTIDQFGCECSSNYDVASSQSPSMCAGMGCCTSQGLCSCGGDASCGDGGGVGESVFECLPSNTGCDGDQVQVTSCSPS